MPKLVSMKLPPRDDGAIRSRSVVADEGPRFPFGLTLHLETEVIEKLAMESMPNIGDEIPMMAMVKVERISVSKDADSGKVEKSLSLQITSMALGEEKEENEMSVEDILFDKS